MDFVNDSDVVFTDFVIFAEGLFGFPIDTVVCVANFIGVLGFHVDNFVLWWVVACAACFVDCFNGVEEVTGMGSLVVGVTPDVIYYHILQQCIYLNQLLNYIY